jgi:hypothetical protein
MISTSFDSGFDFISLFGSLQLISSHLHIHQSPVTSHQPSAIRFVSGRHQSFYELSGGKEGSLVPCSPRLSGYLSPQEIH